MGAFFAEPCGRGLRLEVLFAAPVAAALADVLAAGAFFAVAFFTAAEALAPAFFATAREAESCRIQLWWPPRERAWQPCLSSLVNKGRARQGSTTCGEDKP